MKKVPKHYKNVIRNPEMNKNSQTVYFEDEDECVSLVQIDFTWRVSDCEELVGVTHRRQWYRFF